MKILARLLGVKTGFENDLEAVRRGDVDTRRKLDEVEREYRQAQARLRVVEARVGIAARPRP